MCARIGWLHVYMMFRTSTWYNFRGTEERHVCDNGECLWMLGSSCLRMLVWFEQRGME